jgi:hypothetical protein
MKNDSVFFNKRTSTDFALFEFFCEFLYSLESDSVKKMLAKDFENVNKKNAAKKSVYYYYVGTKLLSALGADSAARYFTGLKKNVEMPTYRFLNFCKVFQDTYKALPDVDQENYKAIKGSFITWRDGLCHKYVSEFIKNGNITELVSQSHFDLISSELEKLIIKEEDGKSKNEISMLYQTWKLSISEKFAGESFAEISTGNLQDKKYSAENNIKVHSKDIIDSNQIALDKFKKQPIYFYYSTKSDKHILYWNVAVLNFSSVDLTSTGRLITEASIPDYDGNKYEYIFEIIRRLPTDSILLKLIVKNENISRVYYAIFDAIENYYDKFVVGFMYHDDWTGRWRLSPCLLGFEPITISKQKEPGRISIDDAVDLQKIWKETFNKNYMRPVFEDLPVTDKHKNSKPK